MKYVVEVEKFDVPNVAFSLLGLKIPEPASPEEA